MTTPHPARPAVIAGHRVPGKHTPADTMNADTIPNGTMHSDRGSATAEYAIATMAAVGFAGLLVIIMRSDEVRGMLTDLVRTALSYGG